MKKFIATLILIFPFTIIHANSNPPDEKMPDDDSELYKNETLESCYGKTVSAYIQSCLIYLEDEKKESYKIAYNQFMEKANQKRKYFFDYNLFIKLIKKAKFDWDKFIKNECLAEATTLEKGGFGYDNLYNQCLIKGYEDRIRYYENYDF